MSVLVVNTPEADRFATAVGRERTNRRGRTPHPVDTNGRTDPIRQ
jgi:hypothetical protein